MFAHFEKARREEPVFYCPEINYWVVTKRADIFDVFRNPRTFSAEIALSPVHPLSPKALKIMGDGGFDARPVQVNCVPPDHTRIRRVAGAYLNAKRFSALEPEIRALVNRYLDGLKGKVRADLVKDFVYDLPALVIFLMLGIPEEDVPEIKRWADNRLLLTFGELVEKDQIAAARDMVAYWQYCRELVAARRENPSDDYASVLLGARDGDDAILSIKEVESLVFGLLLAGHETTTNQAANAFRILLTHRASWEAICDDPGLIPNAVEECLRFQASVVCWRRKALEDVVLSGVKIPKGANILLATASAGRDEDRLPNGETFDICRENAKDHLAFGNGIHFCVGAPLARLELKIILEETTKQFPQMRLMEDQVFDVIRTIAFRGPRELWVDI
jgi:cytochrome P450